MIAELIPIFGMITGLAIILAGIFGFVRLSQGPVGQALARRIRLLSQPRPAERIAGTGA